MLMMSQFPNGWEIKVEEKMKVEDDMGRIKTVRQFEVELRFENEQIDTVETYTFDTMLEVMDFLDEVSKRKGRKER